MFRSKMFAWCIIAVALLDAAPTHAQFGSDALGCRRRLAKSAAKVATTATRSFVGCHAKRAAGKLPATTDCTAKAEADAKGRIDNAAAKLTSAATVACTGLSPNDIAYAQCPAPCDAGVPVLDDFTAVADCMACLGESEAAALSVAVQNAPAVPMATQDRKCFDAIGKSYGKHFVTLLKERSRCQNDAEKAGATTTVGCAAADPGGKIAKTQAKGADKLAASCAGAVFTAVSGCDDASIAALQACTFAESEIRGETLFESYYALSTGVVTTTTTTTTTLPSGDDFEGGSLDPMWSVLHPELVSIDVSGGSLNLVPTASGAGNTWFNDSEGPLVYKSVTGDFDVRAVMVTEDSGAPASPPAPQYRLAGLLARDPASPPGALDWVHVALGSGSAMQGTSYEYKSTDDSVSDWMTTPTPSPDGELRIVRTSADFDLYWRADSVSPWLLIQSFNRPDMPATLDVGMMIYSTDAPASIRARFAEIAFF